jgi:hypothetical protein
MPPSTDAGKFFYARDTQAVWQVCRTAPDQPGATRCFRCRGRDRRPASPTDRGTSSRSTIKWNGDIIAQFIDPNTGKIESGIAWQARDLLQGRVGDHRQPRHLHVWRKPNGLKDFLYTNLTAERTYFNSIMHPTHQMTQCTLLDPLTDLPANNGDNLVMFLRGRTVSRPRSTATGSSLGFY